MFDQNIVYFLLFFFKSGFEIRISCKRINEWLKQDLWLLRQSDSSLLANVLSVTKGGGNYLFSKQFFTFKYLTVKFVGNLCKCHNDWQFHLEITGEIYTKKFRQNKLSTVQSRFSDTLFSDNLRFSDYFTKTIFQFTT